MMFLFLFYFHLIIGGPTRLDGITSFLFSISYRFDRKAKHLNSFLMRSIPYYVVNFLEVLLLCHFFPTNTLVVFFLPRLKLDF